MPCCFKYAFLSSHAFLYWNLLFAAAIYLLSFSRVLFWHFLSNILAYLEKLLIKLMKNMFSLVQIYVTIPEDDLSGYG